MYNKDLVSDVVKMISSNTVNDIKFNHNGDKIDITISIMNNDGCNVSQLDCLRWENENLRYELETLKKEFNS